MPTTPPDRETQEVWRDNAGTILNTLAYSYDGDGEVLTAGNAAGTYTFTYDALGRTATQADLNGITLTFTYDAVGDETGVADSKGGVVSSTYDALDRLTARSQTGTGVTALRAEFAYDAASQVTEERRYNAATGGTEVGATSYAYDAAGNMTQEALRTGRGLDLVTYVNAFDAANRITSETRNGSATSYAYDATNQLLTAGTYSYSFDANGNRNMSGYVTGADNRTSTDGTWTYTYDAAGNTVKKSKGAFAETWTYGYDDRNQLLWAEDRSTDGGTLIQRIDYTTDVYGNVVKEVVTAGGVATTSRFAFVITDASPGMTMSVNPAWAELDASGNVMTRYLLGDDQGQILARDTGTGVWIDPGPARERSRDPGHDRGRRPQHEL